MRDDGEDWLNALFYRLRRVAIRSLRLLVGAIIFWLAAWSAIEAYEKFSIPFAAASVASLVGGAFLVWLAWMLLVWAAAIAFAAAPHPAQDRARLRLSREQEAAVTARAKEMERERHREQAEKLARLPTWRRLLFDPNYASQNPGRTAVAAVVIIGGGFAFFALLAFALQ